jgi:N-acetylglucosamine kinase
MIICIDIGGTAMKGAAAFSAEDIRPFERIATPAHDRKAFEAAIGEMVAANPDAKAVSISTAGVIDPANGRINAANIPCIDGTELQADLEARFGLPFLIANDADCFALAEATLGAGKGEEVVFGIILGTGVGGGLVVNGRIVRGAGGFAGEWGHGPVIPAWIGDPPRRAPLFKCGCGQTGCVDTVGGARGLQRVHQHLHGVEMPSTQIVENWRGGGAAEAETLTLFAELVSGPLAMVVNTVGANVIPAGGGLSNAAEVLALLDKAVRGKILQKRGTPLIVQAQCKVEPGLIGAAIMGLSA